MPTILNTSKLSEAVEKLSLSKLQIAEKCGISRVTLDKALKGQEIGLHKFLKLVDVTGKNIGYFFDEEAEGTRIAVADRGGRATAGDNSPIGTDAPSCNSELVDSLHRQIEYLNSIISAKDEIISLLKSQSPTP